MDDSKARGDKDHPEVSPAPSPSLVEYYACDTHIKQYAYCAHALVEGWSRIAAHIGEDERKTVESFGAIAPHLSITVKPEFLGETTFEILLCRCVDNLNSYVVDIIRQLFLSRPELLKSEKTVTIEEVLGHPTIESFVVWWAERKVESLAYDSFDGLMKYLTERLKIDFAIEPGKLEAVKKAIALRNIIVHNRGRINSRYMKLLSDFGSVGDEVNVGALGLNAMLAAIQDVARLIDIAIVRKFGGDLAKSDYAWSKRLKETMSVALARELTVKVGK